MKLNLLPSSISKSAGSKTAFVLMFVIWAAAAAGTYGLIKKGQDEKLAALDKVNQERPNVQRVMGIAESADEIIKMVGPIQKNVKLIQAMEAHNTVYTKLYRDIFSYVPDFYRVTSITATPNGSAAAIAITGVIKTEQHYTDLALAMLRIPGVTAVSRSGFVYERDFVPNLTPADQDGARIKQGETNLPSDPIEKMEALIQRAGGGTSGFQNVGQFGTGDGPRGAMPKWSTVNISLAINRDLKTPNPRATIEQQPEPAGGRGRGRR